jgi:hypothetical protein
MVNLASIGRIFYGISMTAIGSLIISNKDFPYMLIPPHQSWTNGLAIVAYIFGALLFLAGAAITFGKLTLPISLLLGTALLLIFCFYFIPYELLVSPNYMHFGAWENAEKELALASGAFVVAGCYSGKTVAPNASAAAPTATAGTPRTTGASPLISFLRKLIPIGSIFFPLIIICFGTIHFLYAKEATEYVPSWIPDHLFCIYLGGVGLLGSGIAIILKIRPRLFATLLGAMIFIWVLILHIPYVINASFSDKTGEVTSALIALAYCGIAFVIAGAGKTTPRPL